MLDSALNVGLFKALGSERSLPDWHVQIVLVADGTAAAK